MTRGFPIEQKNADLIVDSPLGQGCRDWPSIAPVAIGWAGMLIFTFYACTRMVAAGDTWVAMACGRHFVNHGVNTVEPFSANSHKAGPTAEEVQTWPAWAQWITKTVGLDTVRYWHPTGWVNQNWLTHVIFYKLTTALGSETEPYYDALVLWKFAIYILAAVALYATARLYGVHPALAAIAVCFGMVIGRSFFDIRPAGFSNLLVAVLILVLALASYKNALYIWLLVPLIVFWSNVHGGYIYAFIVLIPFVAWHAIMHLPRRWMLAAYSILTWLTLYAMANRFTHHEYLAAVALKEDALFYLMVLVIAGSMALSYSRKIGNEALTAYHVAASCILFLLLLPRFFPAMPVNMNRLRPDEVQDLEEFIALSRLSYIGIFSFAMTLGAVVLFLKERVVRVLEVRGILHTIAAGIVAFAAMVIFNPFHLTNLTHTFVISISKHAERWRNVHEWHRAFDWTNPVGTAVPFLIMYILGWLVLLAWTIILIRGARIANRPVSKKMKATIRYTWPQIDLGLLIIAAMTIYMAIRSRRFIPIAGFAACPVIALLLDQAVRFIAGSIQLARTGKFEMPIVPVPQRHVLIIASAGVVAGFGLIWGTAFKHIYLDPWPLDAKYNSVFMRMTASYSKPFEACEFMRINKLSGKMYNYWTEGGFIAWGQEPDPNTGEIPLKLFMDGRAQAAYDVPTFDLWLDILSGGPVPLAAARAGRALTGKDYVEVSKWVSEQLRKYGVWVVLMPDLQFDKTFTIALEYSTEWRIVYIDDKQKLFVDVLSPQGMALYQGMFTGKTGYPNDYLAEMAVGHNLLMVADSEQKKKGLEYIAKALQDCPTPAPMVEMLLIGMQSPELRPRIDDVCQKYVDDFENNKNGYARQDGYNMRLQAARLALTRLEQKAKTDKDTKSAQIFRTRIDQYRVELDRLAQQKKW
ncbi:MAG: hypothetical protein M1376_01755 [Planctomycetes bacterium]|nr:hypothetical protein [Planctomycetota bacterium]